MLKDKPVEYIKQDNRIIKQLINRKGRIGRTKDGEQGDKWKINRKIMDLNSTTSVIKCKWTKCFHYKTDYQAESKKAKPNYMLLTKHKQKFRVKIREAMYHADAN